MNTVHPESHIVRQKISNAFRKLRTMGYFARMNFMCCTTCGCAEIPEDKQDRYVFFHHQNNDTLITHAYCHLAWNSKNPKEIVSVLKKSGLKVKWNGDPDKKFKVHN